MLIDFITKRVSFHVETITLKMAFTFRMKVANALEDLKRELGPAQFAWRMELPASHPKMADLLKSLNVVGVGEIGLPLSREVGNIL